MRRLNAPAGTRFGRLVVLSELPRHVQPSGKSSRKLDRIDNDGNYEPGNVRWATRKEQGLNRCTTRKINRNAADDIAAENYREAA